MEEIDATSSSSAILSPDERRKRVILSEEDPAFTERMRAMKNQTCETPLSSYTNSRVGG